MLGLHFRIGIWPFQYVNIPYWPHRVLVIGRGRLGKDVRFHPWQPSIEVMQLDWCCPSRRAQLEAHKEN